MEIDRLDTEILNNALDKALKENEQLKEEVRYFDKKSTRLMYNIEELEKENEELKKILEIERDFSDCYIDSLKQEIKSLKEMHLK